ncbi:EXPA13 [Symbiodinium natans]|uniref:EXPA13 protein n=1 Tax=Symbiodinium natans TaxID=878477 RepID=A0A812J4J7_9DINO|nr:EXPA13 [Symbiodinium natans]
MMARALMSSWMLHVQLAAAAVHQGTMSMWSQTHDTLVAYKSEGSACKYADRLMGGLNSVTAQTPYITSKNYCAVNRGLFGNGEICGRCYRLTYKGGHEQGLGSPGSDVVQIVDSGSWATFDCHMTAFHKITNYDTGFFPITYEEVACDTSPEGPVAGVLQYDYYFTKMVFSNLRYPVKEAELTIGGKKHEMKLIGGWWSAWTGPITGKTSFQITEENGFVVNFPNCFHGEWTNRKTGDACYTHGTGRSGKLLVNASLTEGVEKVLSLEPVEKNETQRPQLRGANSSVLFP